MLELRSKFWSNFGENLKSGLELDLRNDSKEDNDATDEASDRYMSLSDWVANCTTRVELEPLLSEPDDEADALRDGSQSTQTLTMRLSFTGNLAISDCFAGSTSFSFGLGWLGFIRGGGNGTAKDILIVVDAVPKDILFGMILRKQIFIGAITIGPNITA
jgi:hypothetical protein